MKQQHDFHSLPVAIRVGSDNQWLRLRDGIEWWRFLKLLKKVDKTGPLGGRPRYDLMLMFRMVLLGQWHDLSDREVEQALRVRLDFMLFCGLTLTSEVPDQNTVQLFRMKMIESGILPKCLKVLNKELERLGMKVSKGHLVLDSTIIEAAARPRNITTISEDDDDPPRSSTSADGDAAWTVKGNHNHYGYKEHALVDVDSGFIEDVDITPANVHDGKMLEPMLKGRRGVEELLADKAYASRRNRSYLESRGIKDRILRKAARNHPLSEADTRHNRKISARRFVVEQQFGTKKRIFGFFRTRYFGTARVLGQALLKAICCNLLKASRMLAPPRLLPA
jgi:IS5 family transposase